MLSRSHWEARPLYYIVQRDQIISNENIDVLVQKLPKVTINPAALARFLLEDFSHPQETIFNEIKKIPAGTVVRIQKGRDVLQALPPPDSQIEFSQQMIVEKWKDRLNQHLLELLPQHNKWGVFVSGGLDSCGLVALATDLIRKHQLPVQIELYNLRTDHEESDDQGFCKKLAQDLNWPLYVHQTSPEELAELHTIWQNAKTALPFFPTLQMFAPLMKQANENGCRGVIFGYGMDEQWTFAEPILAEEAFCHADLKSLQKIWCESSNKKFLFKATASALFKKSVPQVIKNLLRSLLKVPVPAHLQSHPLICQQKKNLRRRILQNLPPVSSELQRQFFLRNSFSQNNETNLACHINMAAHYGLHVEFPYLHAPLMEMSFLADYKTLLQLQNKQILREVLRNKLHDQIRLAPKFQDYSQLAYKTALQLQKSTTNLFCLGDWIKTDRELVYFDDDSFFEVLYAEKMTRTYDATNKVSDEKVQKSL